MNYSKGMTQAQKNSGLATTSYCQRMVQMKLLVYTMFPSWKFSSLAQMMNKVAMKGSLFRQ